MISSDLTAIEDEGLVCSYRTDCGVYHPAARSVTLDVVFRSVSSHASAGVVRTQENDDG